MTNNLALTLIAALMVTLACGSSAKRPAFVAANTQIGRCAEPTSAGVVGASPSWWHGDRDLDGDGANEKVLADRSLCQGDNCFWNLFAQVDGCSRYLGTVAGSVLEIASSGGESEFFSLRAWWKLASQGHYLVQTYQYQEGGYALVDVLTCRHEEDDKVLCASAEGSATN